MFTRMAAVAAALALAGAALSGCSSPPSSDGGSADPESLIESRCTQCHDRSVIDAAQKDAAAWEQTIDRMIGKGARLSDAERAALVEHLANR